MVSSLESRRRSGGLAWRRPGVRSLGPSGRSSGTELSLACDAPPRERGTRDPPPREVELSVPPDDLLLRSVDSEAEMCVETTSDWLKGV